MKPCPKCNKKIPDGVSFCIHCNYVVDRGSLPKKDEL